MKEGIATNRTATNSQSTSTRRCRWALSRGPGRGQPGGAVGVDRLRGKHDAGIVGDEGNTRTSREETKVVWEGKGWRGGGPGPTVHCPRRGVTERKARKGHGRGVRGGGTKSEEQGGRYTRKRGMFRFVGSGPN